MAQNQYKHGSKKLAEQKAAKKQSSSTPKSTKLRKMGMSTEMTSKENDNEIVIENKADEDCYGLSVLEFNLSQDNVKQEKEISPTRIFTAPMNAKPAVKIRKRRFCARNKTSVSLALVF